MSGRPAPTSVASGDPIADLRAAATRDREAGRYAEAARWLRAAIGATQWAALTGGPISGDGPARLRDDLTRWTSISDASDAANPAGGDCRGG